jgi:hypothetical protein
MAVLGCCKAIAYAWSGVSSTRIIAISAIRIVEYETYSFTEWVSEIVDSTVDLKAEGTSLEMKQDGNADSTILFRSLSLPFDGGELMEANFVKVVPISFRRNHSTALFK